MHLCDYTNSFEVKSKEERMLSKSRNDENGFKLIKDIIFTLSKCIIGIVILGIILVVVIRAVPLMDVPRLSMAKGVAGAMSSTIAEKHADYLKSGNAYTATDVLNDTQLASGLTTPSIEGF